MDVGAAIVYKEMLVRLGPRSLLGQVDLSGFKRVRMGLSEFKQSTCMSLVICCRHLRGKAGPGGAERSFEPSGSSGSDWV